MSLTVFTREFLKVHPRDNDDDLEFLLFTGEESSDYVPDGVKETNRSGEEDLMMLDGTTPELQTEETPGVRVDLDQIEYMDGDPLPDPEPVVLEEETPRVMVDLNITARRKKSARSFTPSSPLAESEEELELAAPYSSAPSSPEPPRPEAPSRSLKEMAPLTPGAEELSQGRVDLRDDRKRRFGTARLKPVVKKNQLQALVLAAGIVCGIVAVAGMIWSVC